MWHRKATLRSPADLDREKKIQTTRSVEVSRGKSHLACKLREWESMANGEEGWRSATLSLIDHSEWESMANGEEGWRSATLSLIDHSEWESMANGEEGWRSATLSLIDHSEPT